MKKELNNITSLYEMPIGSYGKVVNLTIEGAMRRRLMDLGFVPGSIIKALRKSPIGDPTAFEIKGTVLGLRKEQSKKIQIEIVAGE